MFPFPYAFWAPIILPVIASGQHRKIFPYDLHGPFKQTLMTLFRLAWSSKVQLPLLITVVFMTFDIQLQVEINIIWEANRRDPEPEPLPDHEQQRFRRQLIQQLHAANQAQAPLAIEEDLDDDEDVSSEMDSTDDEDDSDTSAFSSLPSDGDTTKRYHNSKKDDDEDGGSRQNGDTSRLTFNRSGGSETQHGRNETVTTHETSTEGRGQERAKQLALQVSDRRASECSANRKSSSFVPLWHALKRVLEFQQQVNRTSQTSCVAKGLIAQQRLEQGNWYKNIDLAPR